MVVDAMVTAVLVGVLAVVVLIITVGGVTEAIMDH
jgi:hypothetical protein